MSKSVLNLLNVNLPDENEEICVICQQGLSCAQKYELPECGHKFHTHCIVTWFRHRPSSEDESGPDGRCPCCGNTGINNVVNKKSQYYRQRVRRAMSIPEKILFNEAKKQSKKNHDIKKLFDNFELAQNKLKDVQKEVRDYKNTIKNVPTNFQETKNNLRKLRSKAWDAELKVRETRRTILSIPIVPLIIPTPIDLNCT
jgi:hypothetical protein